MKLLLAIGLGLFCVWILEALFVLVGYWDSKAKGKGTK